MAGISVAGPARGGFGRAAEEDHMALADPRQGRMVRRQALLEDRDGAPEERLGLGVAGGGPVEPGGVVGHASPDRDPCWRSPRPSTRPRGGRASGYGRAGDGFRTRARDRASLPLLDAGVVAGLDITRRAGLALARGAVRAAAGAGAGPRGAAQVAAGVAAGDARRGAEAGRTRPRRRAALAGAVATRAALAGAVATRAALAGAVATRAALAGAVATRAALAGGKRLAGEAEAKAGDAGRASHAEREAGDPGDEGLAHGHPPFADENRRTHADVTARAGVETSGAIGSATHRRLEGSAGPPHRRSEQPSPRALVDDAQGIKGTVGPASEHRHHEDSLGAANDIRSL